MTGHAVSRDGYVIVEAASLDAASRFPRYKDAVGVGEVDVREPEGTIGREPPGGERRCRMIRASSDSERP
jgi:hypothetical protein